MIARAVEILTGALADAEHETPEQTANQIAAALEALGTTPSKAGDDQNPEEPGAWPPRS